LLLAIKPNHATQALVDKKLSTMARLSFYLTPIPFDAFSPAFPVRHYHLCVLTAHTPYKIISVTNINPLDLSGPLVPMIPDGATVVVWRFWAIIRTGHLC
jgi:hypothetical protein